MTIEVGANNRGQGGRGRFVIAIEGDEVVFYWPTIGPIPGTEGRMSVAEFEAWMALAPVEE
jgi:hypothetical protein